MKTEKRIVNISLTAVILLLVMMVLSQGCIGPKPVEEELKTFSVPQAWSRSGSTEMPGTWWIVFNDPELNSLIEAALSDNYSLYEAWDRLDQAVALARASGASLLPSVSAEAGVSRSVTVAKMPAGSSVTSYQTNLSIGMSASYEVDLWGKVRSTRKASILEAAASREDLYSAAISISGEVASAWFRLVEQRIQIKLIEKQLATNEQYLKLVESRFKKGLVTATDILQLQQQIEASRADIITAKSSVEILKNQLSVLCGKAPGELDIPEKSELPGLPPMPDTGLPAELIRKRPDIRGAFLRIQGADKRAAAAVASRFPTLSFSARIETSDSKITGLFDNWLGNLISNLTAPLFDGGRLKAEADRTKAAAFQALNGYRGKVLNALREVEDALAREYHQEDFRKSIQKQLAISKQVVDQTTNNYSKGTLDYLRVLLAIQSYERLERSASQAELNMLLYRVRLYRTLGGSWRLKHYREIDDKKKTE